MCWETASHIVTTLITPLAVVVAVFGGYVAWRQVKRFEAIEESKLALEFKTFFQKFQSINEKFMLHGEYANPASRIRKLDWAEIYGYLGAFEMLHRAISNETFGVEFAKNQYRYRLVNIWSNLDIQNRILKQQNFWLDLNALMKDWEIKPDFKDVRPDGKKLELRTKRRKR